MVTLQFSFGCPLLSLVHFIPSHILLTRFMHIFLVLDYLLNCFYCNFFGTTEIYMYLIFLHSFPQLYHQFSVSNPGLHIPQYNYHFKLSILIYWDSLWSTCIYCAPLKAWHLSSPSLFLTYFVRYLLLT